MSLVLWYSIVPFQCLSVWKCISFSLGLLSFIASALRCVQRYSLSICFFVWKIVSLFFGRLFIMPISLLLTGRIRGLLPLIGVIVSVFLSVSKSLHLRSMSSPMRIPVSLRVCSTVDVIRPVADMSRSISCSVGMNGSLV